MKRLLVALLTLSFFISKSQDSIKNNLNDVVISTNRFLETPVTSTQVILDSVTLMAQEVPQVIARLSPSVFSQTDNGTPFGYSYLRVRGLSSEYGQNRVLYSMNGVPLNEGENSHLFTSNFTDLLSNTSSFEFIRGASISGSGSPSFIGAMEMVSKSPFGKRGGEVSGMYGSFNSYRASLSYTTGELLPGFGATIRVSATGSDGFRDNSYDHSQSVYTSLGYRKGNHLIKVVSIIGNTRNGQSYLASPEGLFRTNLLTDPVNGLGAPVQPDQFLNTFTQLQYSYQMGKNWVLNVSPYLLTNNGNYDSPSDFFPPFQPFQNNFNLGLKSKTGGGFINIKYDTRKMNFIIGTNGSYFRVYNTYKQLPSTPLYENSTIKGDINIYTRVSYLLNKNLRVSGDFQARSVYSEYTGTINTKLYNNDGSLNFFNYSFGISSPFSLGRTQFEAYTTFSEVSREPTKTNMFVDVSGYPFYNIEPGLRPRNVSPERNRDLEFGVKIKSNGLFRYDVKFNGFYMNIRNEILSSGVATSIGSVTGYSVKRSQRVGFEVETKYNWNILYGGANFSYQNSKYWSDSSSISNTPLLSPNQILYIYQGVNYKGFKADISYQFISSSFISINDLKTDPVNLLNLNLGYVYKNIELDLLMYNLTNKNQTMAGVGSNPLSGVPGRFFFYSAGISAYFSVKIKF